MSNELQGKRIAILATDGFEQSELTEPRKNLEQAGARTEVLSIKKARSRAGTIPIGAAPSRPT